MEVLQFYTHKTSRPTKLELRCVYVYMPELFPTPMRSSGTGLIVTIGQLGSYLAPYTRLLPQLWMVYGLFTMTTLSGAFVVMTLHETKDKPMVISIDELKLKYPTGDSDIKNQT